MGKCINCISAQNFAVKCIAIEPEKTPSRTTISAPSCKATIEAKSAAKKGLLLFSRGLYIKGYATKQVITPILTILQPSAKSPPSEKNSA